MLVSQLVGNGWLLLGCLVGWFVIDCLVCWLVGWGGWVGGLPAWLVVFESVGYGWLVGWMVGWLIA